VEEMGGKLGASVTGYVGRYTMFREHMSDKEFGEVRSSDFIHCRNEYALFGESVDDD